MRELMDVFIFFSVVCGLLDWVFIVYMVRFIWFFVIFLFSYELFMVIIVGKMVLLRVILCKFLLIFK